MKDFYTITTKVASGLVEIITKMDEYLWISSAWWVEAICDYLRRKKKKSEGGRLGDRSSKSWWSCFGHGPWALINVHRETPDGKREKGGENQRLGKEIWGEQRLGRRWSEGGRGKRHGGGRRCGGETGLNTWRWWKKASKREIKSPPPKRGFIWGLWSQQHWFFTDLKS